MDKAALVTADLVAGSRILEILDGTGLQLNMAMWLRTPEYEDWRFALSSRDLDSAEPSTAYGLVHDALDQKGFPLESTPPLLIIRTTDPFVRTLRRIFGKAKNVEGMRLGGQTIGGRFIEDAIVYRIR
jgi:hypothetical protein